MPNASPEVLELFREWASLRRSMYWERCTGGDRYSEVLVEIKERATVIGAPWSDADERELAEQLEIESDD